MHKRMNTELHDTSTVPPPAERLDHPVRPPLALKLLPAETDLEDDATHRSAPLLDRLKERKFFKWLLGYMAVAFMGLQIVDVLGEVWGWSLALQRSITLTLGVGVVPATIVAWFHGEKGRQRVSAIEAALVSLTTVSGAALVWWVCL